MTAREKTPSPERLLTLSEAAAILSTSERFPRRLIDERRIRFARVGRHVRIPEPALAEFIAAGMVEPVTSSKRRAALWATVKAVVGASALSENSNPASGRRVIAAQTR